MRLILLIAALLVAAASPAAAQKRIALSFDDIPRAPGAWLTPDQRTVMLIAALERGGVDQAAFFVTTGNLEHPHGSGGEDRIQAYVAAGHVIANHSHSHGWAHSTPVADYVADIDRASAWLQGRPGYRPWYRFPFLDEGRDTRERRDALRAALRERSLANGYVTVDTYDWFIEERLKEAVAAGREIDRDALRDLYVESIVEASNFTDSVARETLGRSPAHMILLHETDIAALYIDDAVAALRADGWEIITADEAYADPIAVAEPDTLFLGGGRIAALAHVRGGRPARELVSEWTEEDHLTRQFNSRVLHQTEDE
ncbi:polysaccharide deacetylase family protein [Sphingosinicella terrae]|uniref:polysaccharide deacetylase family protein n=1 Tax=Sphingosinicella terrae TaxID=2172047 RepID=UPI000E0D4998|nr:polysaccharide deacetylase family protein [Sphingosinicella terrae]